MTVAIDATPLTLSTGGIVRYTRELATALAEQFPEDSYILLSDQPFEAPLPCPPNLRRGRPPRQWLDRRWWLCGVQGAISRSGAELFHGGNFMVPWLPVRPSVMTLHDLSPWIEASWRGDMRYVRRRAPYQIGLGLATMIITPSEAVRSQAIGRFGIHPSRIKSVPLAAAAWFRPVPVPPAPKPYFLFVGALEPRKNLETLLDAWRAVHARHGAELFLAGPVKADFRPPRPEPGLRLLGEVPDTDLPALYSGASACLYPSLYEGFGLPVLEAMQCGALVIASREAAISETAGGAGILLDPGDAGSWAKAMAAAAAKPEAMAGWRVRAVERAKSFSWARSARQTREVYEEAVRRVRD